MLERFKQGCKRHFAARLWTDTTQSHFSLLLHHLSDTWERDAAVQTVCDLFWSTVLKELFGSQITYLWAFLFSMFIKHENRETKRCIKDGVGEKKSGRTKNWGILHYLKNASAIKHMWFIKSQAKSYTRGVESSHFINHFKHEGVSAISKLYKRETNSKASEMQTPELGEAGFITLSSKPQVTAV